MAKFQSEGRFEVRVRNPQSGETKHWLFRPTRRAAEKFIWAQGGASLANHEIVEHPESEAA